MLVQHTQRSSRHSPKFPNRIREYRLKAGLTQRKLAELLGRGKDAVSAWERGLNLPSVPRLLRMAKILGTLAESLYMDFYSTYPKDESASPASA
jgi:transcriptional regulator with XRE-family HTH domain